jgi:signal peptidase I
MPEQNAGLPHPAAVSEPTPVATPLNGTTNGQTATKARPLPKTKPEASTTETKDGLREVIETVVFVVVLVLLLKAFVAEAFVIPTGSMAETLWGYQKLVTCPKCGEEFPVNCSNEVAPQEGRPARITGCTCPNCWYHIDFALEGMNPSWNSGDRVLVGKFLYDFGLFGLDQPKRDQVVVFKYPREPQRNYEALNYIKRCKGLPGETIAIHYGRLYVYDGLKYDDSDVDPKDLWRDEHMHQNDEFAVQLFNKGKFRILRKSPTDIVEMRRLVYDNDHQAKDLINKVPPRWAADSNDTGWTTDNVATPRRFEHTARSGSAIDWLRYSHLVPDSDRRTADKQLITDMMGYNTWEAERYNHSLPPQNWVGDLSLDCDIDVRQAEGSLVVELSHGMDRFQARWDLTTGQCTLVRLTGGREEKLDSKDTILKRAGTYQLRFANVDQRLTLWINGQLVFGDGVSYDAPRRLGPTENDFQPASIGVQGGGVVVSGLKLYRDTYYTLNSPNADATENVDFRMPNTWDPLQNLAVKTLYVQPGHFLCLGDNSPESSDGRTWGLVPSRLLLGRALLIYYPFQRKGRIE